MVLEGTLDAFTLPDVLRSLAAAAKSGCLQVEGDRGQGTVWVSDGGLTAATAEGAPDTAPVDEQVFELLRFERGSFRFTIEEPPANGHHEPQDIVSTLRQAVRLLDEWHELEAVVPSLDHRIALAEELSRAEVTVDARLWPALVAIAAGGTVKDLAERLDLGELEVVRLVAHLVELDMAVVQPPGEQPTAPAPEADRRAQPAPAEVLADRAPLSGIARRGGH